MKCYVVKVSKKVLDMYLVLTIETLISHFSGYAFSRSNHEGAADRRDTTHQSQLYSLRKSGQLKFCTSRSWTSTLSVKVMTRHDI